VLFTILAPIPGGAHLLELANKMRLDQRDYFVAQSLYRGWQLVGFLVVAALAANIWAASLHEAAAFWWFVTAAGLIAATLVVFFGWTFPVNKKTNMWTVQPSDWRELWEYSHAANAAITFLRWPARRRRLPRRAITQGRKWRRRSITAARLSFLARASLSSGQFRPAGPK
jgi:hypothetical protein